MRPTTGTMLQQNNNNNYPCLNVSGSTREMLQKCSRASLPFPSRLELGLGDLPLIRGLRAWALCSKNRRKPGALGGGPAPMTPPVARGSSASCPRPADVYLSGEWVRMGYGLPLGLDVRQAGIGALVTVATLKTSEGNGKTQTQCLFLQTENGSCLYSTSKPGSGGVGGWLRGKTGGGAARDAYAERRDTGPGLQSQTRNQVRVRSGRRWRKSGNVAGVSRERQQTSEEDPGGERQERPNKGAPHSRELAGPAARCCHSASPKTCAQCGRRPTRKPNKEELEQHPRGDDPGAPDVDMKDMKKKEEEEEEEEGKEGLGGSQRHEPTLSPGGGRGVGEMGKSQSEEEPKTTPRGGPASGAFAPPQRPSAPVQLREEPEEQEQEEVEKKEEEEEEEGGLPVRTSAPEGGSAECGTAQPGSSQLSFQHAEQGIVGEGDVGATVSKALGKTGSGGGGSPAGLEPTAQDAAGDESAEGLKDERVNTQTPNHEGHDDEERRIGNDGHSEEEAEGNGAADNGGGRPWRRPSGDGDDPGQRGDLAAGGDVTHVAGTSPPASPPPNPAPSLPPAGAMATGLPRLEAAGISATGAGGREGSGERGGELESPGKIRGEEEEEEQEEEEEEDEFGGFMQAEGEPGWSEGFTTSAPVPCGSKGSAAALGDHAIGSSSDWAPSWTDDSFHQPDDDSWTAFPQDGSDDGGDGRGQWWPAGAQEDRADKPAANHSLAALFAEAFPLMPDSTPSDPCDADAVPTLAQLLGGGTSQDKGLLDSFHDLNKMIGQRNKRARGMSRDLLLRTLRFEQPPAHVDSRAAPWSASRRLSPGHPASAPHHAHNAAAKRRLSYDHNRNIME